MTIAIAIAAILATLFSPLIAVQVQKWIERATERRNAQQNIFRTLMATRATRLDPNHVHALNSIDLDFGTAGRRQNPREREVIDRWRLYADQLNLALPEPSTEAQQEAWVQRADDLFIELLFALSQCLGYSFDRVQLRRAVYRPRGHGQVELRQDIIQRGFAGLFTGETSLPMRVIEVPVSAEVIDLQKATQEAILGALDGGALKVKREGT